jgi:hypothetical protein
MPANAPALSPKLIKDISDFLFEGFNNDDVSFYFGLPPELVQAIRLGTAFKDVRRQVINRKHYLIRKVLTGKKLAPGIVWFLERRYPHEFSKPETQLGLVNGPSVNNTLVVSAELAERLVQRSKPLDDQLNKLLKERDQRSVLTDVSHVSKADVNDALTEETSPEGDHQTLEPEGHAPLVPPPVTVGHSSPSSDKNLKISDSSPSSGENPEISNSRGKRKSILDQPKYQELQNRRKRGSSKKLNA